MLEQGSDKDLQTQGERSSHQSRFPDRTCDPVEGRTLEQCILEGLHLAEE